MKSKLFPALALIAAVFAINTAAQQAGDAGGRSVEGKSVSGGVLNGKATQLVKPAYPAAARAVRASGAVNVQVTIDEEGNVISADAVSGHPLLRKAAVDAALQSTFQPTRLSGQLVKVTGVIVYNFVPDKATNYKSEAEMFVPLGIPLFLTAMKLAEPDDEMRRLFRQLADTLPNDFRDAKASLMRLSKTRAKADRDQLVDSVVESFLSSLTGTDLWLAELGKAWGDAVVSTGPVSKSNTRSNRRRFDLDVVVINNLLANPPEDVSPAFLRTVRAITAYDDEATAQSGDFVVTFLQGSMKFIETVIKDK